VISILVVGAGAEAEEPPSAIEVLHAAGVEDALEKLARNRRIDAVLVLASDAREFVDAVVEEVVAPPPLFLPADGPAVSGARRLEPLAADVRALLDAVAVALSS
jgi:hypothetical protein